MTDPGQIARSLADLDALLEAGEIGMDTYQREGARLRAEAAASTAESARQARRVGAMEWISRSLNPPPPPAAPRPRGPGLPGQPQLDDQLSLHDEIFGPAQAESFWDEPTPEFEPELQDALPTPTDQAPSPPRLPVPGPAPVPAEAPVPTQVAPAVEQVPVPVSVPPRMPRGPESGRTPSRPKAPAAQPPPPTPRTHISFAPPDGAVNLDPARPTPLTDGPKKGRGWRRQSR